MPRFEVYLSARVSLTPKVNVSGRESDEINENLQEEIEYLEKKLQKELENLLHSNISDFDDVEVECYDCCRIENDFEEE